MSSSLSSLSSSSSSSSKKVSSSSVSSSTKIASSSALSSSSLSSGGGMSADVDQLLAASLSARESARGLASGMSERLGRGMGDLDVDEMLSGVSLGAAGTGTSSTSISSSSSSKKATKMSSISQSSLEMGDGVEGGVKSSVKSHSSSEATSAVLATKQASVDGELVLCETVGEKESRARESHKEKSMEGGQVTSASGYNMDVASSAKLRATKEMSQEELDDFFKQKAITGKAAEALNFDKDANVFEARLSDLSEFSPQELTVKIVDGVITVYGTHVEEIDEKNCKTHTYVRRFTIPKELKTDNVGWQLEPSGVLAIKAGESVKGGFSECHLNCTIFKPRSFFKKAQ